MNSFRSCPEISSEAKQRLYVVGHILAVSAKASVACCSQVFDSIFPPLLKIFEAFGLVELVQLPLDPETGHCKGFGFVQVDGIFLYLMLLLKIYIFSSRNISSFLTPKV
ncbi:hypothetical protein SAY87_016430 [Trapa incisa]|uniref:RRM domain-containing protein n=1 Tax=Trapa incisa TaxID=236973 RepID=A0AAN7L985_9MYRT|nr:hypothetical protein SAY87_016430 [Trapa incisa]